MRKSFRDEQKGQPLSNSKIIEDPPPHPYSPSGGGCAGSEANTAPGEGYYVRPPLGIHFRVCSLLREPIPKGALLGPFYLFLSFCICSGVTSTASNSEPAIPSLG